MTLVNLCLVGTFTFTPTEFTATTYSIYTPSVTLHTDQTEVVESETTAPCPILEFDVVNFGTQDDADSTVFTQINTGSTDFDLTIETSDTAKTSPHSLTVRVKYEGVIYTITEDVHFTITIDDPCQTSVLSQDSSFTSSTELALEYQYRIGYIVESIEVFQADITSTVSHAYCPLYTFDMLDQSGASIDAALFTFVHAGTTTLTTTDPNDLIKVGVYTFELSVRYDGDIAHYTNVFTYDFTIELLDPCLLGTFTISPSILTSTTVTWNIQTDPAYVLTLVSSEVVESETSPVCPIIVYSFESSVDQTALDPAVFTYTAGVQEFEVYTQDTSKHDVYPIKMKAKYDGVQYTNEGDIDFTVTVVDLCILPEYPPDLQPVSQTPSVDYLYDAGSAAAFSLAPFVSSPSFCEVTYSCTVISGPRTDICSNHELPALYGIATFDTVQGDYTLNTDDCVNIRPEVYTLKVIGTIGSYQNVFESITFDLNLINPCRPECIFSSITPPTIDFVEYTIGNSELEINFDEFILDIGTGNCPYVWIYYATLSNFSPLPSDYISFDDEMRRFTIYATKGTDQTFRVRLKGQLQGGSENLSEEITFGVSIFKMPPYYHFFGGSDEGKLANMTYDNVTAPVNETTTLGDASVNSTTTLGDAPVNETSTLGDAQANQTASLDQAELTEEEQQEAMLTERLSRPILLEEELAQEGAGFLNNLYMMSKKNQRESATPESEAYLGIESIFKTPPVLEAKRSNPDFEPKFSVTMTSTLIVPSNLKDIINKQKERRKVLTSFGKSREEHLTRYEKEVLKSVLELFDQAIQERKLEGQELTCTEAETCPVDSQFEASSDAIFVGEIDESVDFVQIIGIYDVMQEDQGLDWEITEANGDNLNIKISFSQPINISQFDDADSLIVLLNLQQFEDVNGNSLDSNLILKVLMPRLIKEGTLSETSQDFSAAAGEGTTASSVVSFVIMAVMGASLNELWGMIHALQITTHLPLCNIKFPANAVQFNGAIIEIAIFDLVSNGMMLDNVYFPQVDNFNLAFQTIGYESTYAVPNLGTIFFIFLGYLILVPISSCLTFFSVDNRDVRKPAKKLRRFLYWKGTFRFLLESHMEIVLAVTLNVKMFESNSGYIGVDLSNGFTIVFFIISLVLPIWIAIFYYRKQDQWKDEEFDNKWGDVLDGMKKEYHELDDGKRWIAVWYPVITLLRRTIFIFTIVFYPAFTWLQLATTFLSIQVMWNYLVYYYPMEDLFTNRMEIFGELTNLILMYHMMLFTDFVADVELRYATGYSFILFITVFISVHMYFMLKESITLIKESLAKRCAKLACVKAMKQREEREREEAKSVIKLIPASLEEQKQEENEEDSQKNQIMALIAARSKFIMQEANKREAKNKQSELDNKAIESSSEGGSESEYNRQEQVNATKKQDSTQKVQHLQRKFKSLLGNMKMIQEELGQIDELGEESPSPQTQKNRKLRTNLKLQTPKPMNTTEIKPYRYKLDKSFPSLGRNENNGYLSNRSKKSREVPKYHRKIDSIALTSTDTHAPYDVQTDDQSEMTSASHALAGLIKMERDDKKQNSRKSSSPRKRPAKQKKHWNSSDEEEKVTPNMRPQKAQYIAPQLEEETDEEVEKKTKSKARDYKKYSDVRKDFNESLNESDIN